MDLIILKLCRFQHLRDLIPQNDQKTDRASFLLEVCIVLLYSCCCISFCCIFIIKHDFESFYDECRSYNISTFYKKSYRFMKELVKAGVQRWQNYWYNSSLYYLRFFTCGKTMLDMILNEVLSAELEVATINKACEWRLTWFGHRHLG